jgi:hypothetical protein
MIFKDILTVVSEHPYWTLILATLFAAVVTVTLKQRNQINKLAGDLRKQEEQPK